MNSNWKTTTLGILTIVSTLIGAAIAYLSTGVTPNFTTLIAGLTAGWGLVHAKDAVASAAPKTALQTLAIIGILSIPLFGFWGCKSTAFLTFQTQVQKAQTWAESPSGQSFLNTVIDGAEAFVQANGGEKSRANVSNAALAIRSLETGKIPPVSILTSTIASYTGSSSEASKIADAVVAAATAAPSPNTGLEAAAKTLDSVAAGGS